jgi:DNA-binding transcriptional regulator YdaS (Cro superfamily)
MPRKKRKRTGAAVKNEVIRSAIHAVGTQAALARAGGFSQQHVSKLLNGERTASGTMALKIERATGGAVTRADVRPDLFADLMPRRDA